MIRSLAAIVLLCLFWVGTVALAAEIGPPIPLHPAPSAPIVTGEDLRFACNHMPAPECTDWVRDFTAGINGRSDICISPLPPAEQLAGLTMRYLSEHQELLDKLAGVGVWGALHQVYACKRERVT